MENLKHIYLICLVLGLFFLVACNKDKESPEQKEEETVVVSDNSKTKTNKKKSAFSSFDFEVLDANSNRILELGENLEFKVKRALGVSDPNKFKWQFGDGGEGFGPNVLHKYKEEGNYMVTLLLEDGVEIEEEELSDLEGYTDEQIDSIKLLREKEGKKKKKSYKVVLDKIIEVKNIIKPSPLDSVVRIFGPSEGFVGEELVFRALGTGVKKWYWEFGEREGLVSSEAGGQVVHKYLEPGDYTIRVNTNLSEYPSKHNITIFSLFEPLLQDTTEAVDSIALFQNDIKEHLQKIADAKISDIGTFKKNMDYILDKYICHIDSIVVITNGSRYNDFVSYCQGIHHLDSEFDKTVTVQEVIIDTVCVKKMEVSQVVQSLNFE